MTLFDIINLINRKRSRQIQKRSQFMILVKSRKETNQNEMRLQFFIIISMGGNCCSNEVLLQEGEQNKKEIENEAHVTLRQGKPRKAIGINIHEMTAKFSNSRNWAVLNEKIFNVLDLEKKKKIPFQIRRNSIAQNDIQQPYYLPYLKAFYVGEWVFDKHIGEGENVPGGLGRLYEDNCITQGMFLTFEPKHRTRQNILRLDLEDYVRDKTRNQMFEKINEDQFLSSAAIIAVKLNGTGRMYNREYELSGNFKKGILNGKGKCKINKKGEIYQYEGDWKNGKRDGKGKEKTKLTEYEGYFKQNIKEGKGQQIFYLSTKEQTERKEEEQDLIKKLKQDGEQLRLQAQRQFSKNKNKDERILHSLRKYPWKKVFYETSIFDDENFFFERKVKKFHLENYNGEFKNDLRDGHGVYVWRDGKTYNGEWKEGKMHGRGEFYWPDGSIYRGQYENDLKHGQGIMIWNIKQRYRGFWAFGVRHGYGEAIDVNFQTGKLTLKGEVWVANELKQIRFEKQLDVKKEEGEEKEGEEKEGEEKDGKEKEGEEIEDD